MYNSTRVTKLYDRIKEEKIKEIYLDFKKSEEYRMYIQFSNYVPKTKRITFCNVHNSNHSKRVLFLVLVASNLSHLTEKEKLILAYAAVYHDIGRRNDLKDDRHGYYSFKRLCEMKEFEVLVKHQLTDEEIRILEFIIKNHCIKDTIAYENLEHYPINNKALAIKLFKYLKDADNLDRVRIGDLDEKYLRLDTSKKLVEFAKWLYANREAY